MRYPRKPALDAVAARSDCLGCLHRNACARRSWRQAAARVWGQYRQSLQRAVVASLVLAAVSSGIQAWLFRGASWSELGTDLALDLLIWGGFGAAVLLYHRRFLRRQWRTQMRQSLRAARSAERDPIIHTHNRLGLMRQIEADAAMNPTANALLLVLDIREFQRINDGCGHSAGDRLLCLLAQRLRTHLHDLLRPSMPAAAAAPLLARVGADEFALWLPNWTHGDAHTVAQHMLAALREPFVVFGHTLAVHANVGHASGPSGLANGALWLTRANTALQEAKRLGHAGAVGFLPSMHDASLRRQRLEEDLRTQLAHPTDLLLHFQPLMDVKLGQLSGCEVLCRWQHPELGWVPPVDFIQVAEQSGLIHELGRWVLGSALQTLAKWRRDPEIRLPAAFKTSVNLSRLQLQDPLLPVHIQKALDESGIEASALDLEITENHPLDGAETCSALQRLRALGVSLSLDDFGTGYASLSMLLKLPLQSVKLDRILVAQLDQHPHQAALVAGVLRTAALMGVHVTAEGVEHPDEWSTLERMGCDRIQGWLVGKPMNATAFARQWLCAPCTRPSGPIATATAVRPPALRPEPPRQPRAEPGMAWAGG